MYFIEDENFARRLQNEYQAYENFRKQKEGKEKENSNPIDSKLEYMDPTPSIHDLFMKFNKKFFWNALGMVEVVWSHRMTKCAGLCSFEGGRGLCKISLSGPLLSLRPRKDLVETLLHEMIHAYLFVTHNYKDREDHGPEFHKHMFRINKEAGTNITVYHTFFNEVEYYQRHIWRCDGPCRNRKPYFGFVRRAMNRAPGPNDSWWSEHKQQCNGTFIKIAEPEKKPKQSRKVVIVKPEKNHKDIRDYFTQKGSSRTNVENQKKTNIKTLADFKEKTMTGIKTYAVSGSAVVITSIGKENPKTKNPSKTSKKSPGKVKTSGNQSRQSTGARQKTKPSDNEVRKTVRSKWANKFTNSKPPEDPSPKKMKIDCPVCGDGFSEEEIQNHVDECLENENDGRKASEAVEAETSNCERKTDELKNCPVCSGKVLQSEMNAHLENCLKCIFANEGDSEVTCESVPCPCCYKWFPESEMNDHIDECLTLNTLKEEILSS